MAGYLIVQHRHIAEIVTHYIIGVRYRNKGVFVALPDDLLQPLQLETADHANQHILFLLAVAAMTFEHSNASVDF